MKLIDHVLKTDNFFIWLIKLKKNSFCFLSFKDHHYDFSLKTCTAPFPKIVTTSGLARLAPSELP